MIKKILSTFLLVLVFTATPIYATNDREHSIAEFQINIHIYPDGSAQVEERITNRFIGEFNGVFRDINRRGIGDIDNFLAWEYLHETGEYIPFIEARRAREGDSGVFTSQRSGNVSSFQIFSPSRDEIRTFVYSYTLTQVATRFSDVGQFNHYVMGSEWHVSIENYEVRITFEGAALANPGELSAAVYIGGSRTWEFVSATNDIAFHSYGTELRPGETLRINAHFPEHWLYEARQLNRSIDTPPFPWAIVIILGVLALILIPIIVILIMARPHRVDFSEKYYDKLPADNGPALMAYLVRDRQLNIKDVIATLLHLARDGIVIISTDQHDEHIFTRDFGFMRSLRPHENFLMEWLFDGIGDGTCFELSTIQLIGENEESAMLFYEKFTRWSEIVKKEGEQLEYFESYFRRSPYGELEYRKWRAFKRYLKNLTEVERVDIDTHEFWNNFLPYALSLGSTKKLIKKLPDIPMPGDTNSLDASNALWFSAVGAQFLGLCNNAFNQTHHRGYSYIAGSDSSYSSSSYSSGSSGGGGGGAF